MADILHVPKDEFDTISDLAAEPAYDKEASELVLAAVNQGEREIKVHSMQPYIGTPKSITL